MLKCGMNLKFETIVQIFRKIIRLNAVIILKSTNEYCRKIISKSGFKMYLYPAMVNSINCVRFVSKDQLFINEPRDTIYIGFIQLLNIDKSN